MQPASASRAAPASSPSADSRRVVPRLAPSASTARRLFASASRPLDETVTRDLKPSAARTKSAAGRACRSTPDGSSTSVSELVGTAGILGCLGDLVDACADRRDNCRGDRALDEGRVRKPDVPIPVALEHMADGENRAAEVTDHDDTVAGVRAPDGVADAIVVGAEAAIGQPTGVLYCHFGAGHLRGKRGQTAGNVLTVRYEYQANHCSILLGSYST